jgi:uncharacterized protein YjbI with pentapeptide repeats
MEEFIGTDLGWADLNDPILVGAILADANLSGADLDGAIVSGADSLTCEQLRSANNWKPVYRDKDLACGAPIPERLDQRDE